MFRLGNEVIRTFSSLDAGQLIKPVVSLYFTIKIFNKEILCGVRSFFTVNAPMLDRKYI